jgi:predicted ester cyclase
MEINNLSVLRNVVELGFGNCDLALVDELIGDDYIEHQFGMKGGKEGLKKSIRSLHTAFPDMRYTLLKYCEAGDIVWTHFNASGTHSGSFMQSGPSGKKFSIDVIDMARVSNGKITEHWGMPDRFALLFQLGLMEIKQEIK